MKKEVYDTYVSLLHKELTMATGCTEPIAIAYAGARLRAALGAIPEHCTVYCSGNIVKNVMAVTVPNSGGAKGIDTAAMLGIVGGDADSVLDVLHAVTQDDIDLMNKLLAEKRCDCELVEGVENLYIRIEAECGSDTALVEIKDYHSNVTRLEKNGVPLIVDASQSAGSLEVNQQKLQADFIAMPGHKGLFGPQGTGILIASKPGNPFMSGGSGADSMLQTMPDYLPDRYEAGTHNVCGIAGLLEGIRYVSANGAENIGRHEAELAQMLGGMIKDTDGLEVFMGAPGTQSGVLSVRSSKIECGEFASALGDRGICVRSGLHCSPYAHKSAGTINTGTVRFSFSPFVSKKETEICADVVKELLYRSN